MLQSIASKLIKHFLIEFYIMLLNDQQYKIVFINKSFVHPNNYKQHWWSRNTLNNKSIHVIICNHFSFVEAMNTNKIVAI